MNRFLQNKWFYRVLALILAILLFVYVNQSRLVPSNNRNSQSNTHITQQLSSTKKARVSIPLQLDLNSDRYFVSGYPEKIKVNLSGPSALVTTVANTQNFKAYVDLNGMGVGNHEVRPLVSGLNSELRYRVSPAKVRLKIQPRQTRILPINVKYSRSAIASGYHVDSSLNLGKSAKISGPANSVLKVRKVIALVTLDKAVNHSVHARAVLEALDKKGHLVNVMVSPSTVKVKLPVVKNNN